MANEIMSAKGVAQTEMTAAQRALSIREIVTEILSYFAWYFPNPPRKPTYSQLRAPKATLLRCGRVNRLWFEQAMRYLWNSLDDEDQRHLPTCFRNIEPNRKPLYANLVVSGSVGLFRSSREAEKVLGGCVFHNLHTLHIQLVGSGTTTAMFLPRINAPRLDVVEIHIPAHHEVIIRTQGKILKARFPAVLQVGLTVSNQLLQPGSHVLT
jgi:hypothetical protein